MEPMLHTFAFLVANAEPTLTSLFSRMFALCYIVSWMWRKSYVYTMQRSWLVAREPICCA